MLPNKLKEKCNELADYFDQPAWKNRILFYSAIFLSIALAFIIIFGIFNLIIPNFTFPNNAINYDNERYLLSALVQSLAATIALVITLSLVAVQLAAQSYSPRVIDAYKKNPDMWILLCIYIITIFYGLGLIKIVELDISGINMEGAIFVAYFMGFFAFVCLVPYMLKTLDLLKPSTVIKLLAEEITKERVIEALEKDGEISEKDPIQPIIDMINESLERNDYETVRNGLSAIKNSAVSIFEKTHIDKKEEWKIASYLLAHMERIGIHAIKKENEDSAKIVVLNLAEIGKKTADQRLGTSTIKVQSILRKIGTNAVDKDLEMTVWEVAEALEYIGYKTAERKLQYETNYSEDGLKSLMKSAEDKNWYEIVEIITEALHSIEEMK